MGLLFDFDSMFHIIIVSKVVQTEKEDTYEMWKDEDVVFVLKWDIKVAPESSRLPSSC